MTNNNSMKTIFKEILKDTISVVIGALLYAAGLCLFTAPFGILSGGASGISIVLNHLTKIPTGTGIFLVNIPLFIAAFFVCGKKYTLRTVWACLVFSTVIDVFNALVTYRYHGDKLLCVLYGGIFMGVGLYIIMMRSIVTGGSDLLAYIIQRKNPAYSISTLVLIIDVIIVLGGALVYQSTDSALYSVLLIIVLTLVLDTLLRGRTHGTLYFILSDKSDKIQKEIMHRLERGVTAVDAKGGYTGAQKQMLMCTVSKREAALLRTLVFEIDADAFVIASAADGVYGLGFATHEKEDIF